MLGVKHLENIEPCKEEKINNLLLHHQKTVSFNIVMPFFFFPGFFQGHTHSIQKFLGQRLKRSYSYQPMPQPQQHRIQARSVTYTTAHANARSLTHGARPGIEPVSTWRLVWLTTEPQWELLTHSFIHFFVLPILTHLQSFKFGDFIVLLIYIMLYNF